MLKKNNRTLLLVGLLVLAGLFLALVNVKRDRFDAQSVQPSRSPLKTPAAQPSDVTAPMAEPGVRVAVSRPVPPPPAESAPAVKEKKSFGSIHGYVFDSMGVPQAGAWVMFCRETPFEGTFKTTVERARADSHGYYLIKQIAVGKWNARLIEPKSHGRDQQIEFGEVEVLENQSSSFDFVITGIRTIKGQIVWKSPVSVDTPRVPSKAQDKSSEGAVASWSLDSSYVSLRLEMRKREEPKALVAVTHVPVGFDQPLKTWDPKHADSPEDLDPVGKGDFKISRLEPNLYTLRIVYPGRITDIDTGDTYDLFLEQDVDLQLGDVELPPMMLENDDFVRAAYVRESEKKEEGR